MAIPICDDCAKRELGELYNKINYDYIFYTDCIACDDPHGKRYAIPEMEEPGESYLDAVKRYLDGVVMLEEVPCRTCGELFKFEHNRSCQKCVTKAMEQRMDKD